LRHGNGRRRKVAARAGPHAWSPIPLVCLYGYAGIPDPAGNVQAPEDAGIWKVSLETGKPSLLISWILCDTYPDKDRNQNPYLLHLITKKVVPLGHFRSPPEYKGEWRCDLHPRFSPDGTKVTIDSPHGGNGRQLYMLDIRGLCE